MARRKLYDPNTFPLLAEKYARNGLADKQIWQNLGVGRNAFYAYINEYPDFKEALKRGKKPVDIQVENAMLKICLGYEYEEKTTEYEKGLDGKPIPKRTKVVKKYVAPDAVAIKFWLINRDPNNWQNKKDIDLSAAIIANIDTTKYTDEEKEILLKAARKGEHIKQ